MAWLLAIWINDQRGLSLDDQYVSIMTVTFLYGTATVLFIFGYMAQAKSRIFWGLASLLVVLGFNALMWLSPSETVFTDYKLFGVLVINAVLITTLPQAIKHGISYSRKVASRVDAEKE